MPLVRQHAGRGEKRMLEAAAVLAVGATAVAFVAGIGTYLYIRLTQNRRKLPAGGERPSRTRTKPGL